MFSIKYILCWDKNFQNFLPSVTILKNDEAKFKTALRKHLHTQTFKSVDEFLCVKVSYNTVFVKCLLYFTLLICIFVYFCSTSCYLYDTLMDLWYVCINVCICMYECMNVCMYVCMYVSMYICVYVCVCMYVRIYVCVYVCTYVCRPTDTLTSIKILFRKVWAVISRESCLNLPQSLLDKLQSSVLLLGSVKPTPSECLQRQSFRADEQAERLSLRTGDHN